MPENGARLDCTGCNNRLVVRANGEVAAADEAPDDDLSEGLTASFTLIDGALPERGEAGKWHISDGQGGYQKLNEYELVEALTEGRILPSDTIWRPGLEAWTPIERDPEALELLRAAGPWKRGTITSIFEAAELLDGTGDRASVVAADAPAAVAALTGRPTVAPTGLPTDVEEAEEDDLGDRPEVILANEGLLRPGDAASPVAGAVQRNQRRLLMLAIGIPLFIIIVWTILAPRDSAPPVVSERKSEAQRRGASDDEGREIERRRRQRLLLEEGSYRLTSDQKAAVIEAGLPDLEDCGSARRGGARITFRIKPNGAPFDIRVEGMRGDGSRCVRQKVARWRFPRFTGPVDEMSFPLRSH